MEDKLKDIFEHLDEKETDILLSNVKSDNSMSSEKELNEENIKRLVLEKLDLKPKNTKKKIIKLNWKIYSIGAAACVMILIGALIFFNSDSKLVNKTKPVDIAQTQPETIDNQSAENDKDNSIINDETESGKIDKDKDDKEPSNKTNKNDKDKKDKDKKKPIKNESSQVIAGENKDDPGAFKSEDVDELLDNSTDDIDMETFEVTFDSIDKLSDESDYVVKGYKTASTLESSTGEDEYDLFAEFKIDKVLSNNAEKDIADTIMIKEGIRYNAESKCYTHIGGYSYMKTGKEYIIFIKKQSKHKYKLTTLLCGKVPLDKDEQIVCIDSDFLGKDDVNKLKKFCSDAREKYSDKKDTPVATSEPAVTAEPTDEPNSSNSTKEGQNKDSSNKDNSGKENNTGLPGNTSTNSNINEDTPISSGSLEAYSNNVLIGE